MPEKDGISSGIFINWTVEQGLFFAGVVVLCKTPGIFMMLTITILIITMQCVFYTLSALHHFTAKLVLILFLFISVQTS